MFKSFGLVYVVQLVMQTTTNITSLDRQSNPPLFHAVYAESCVPVLPTPA